MSVFLPLNTWMEPGWVSVGDLFSKSQIQNSSSTEERFYSFTAVYVHFRQHGFWSKGLSELEIQLEGAFQL